MAETLDRMLVLLWRQKAFLIACAAVFALPEFALAVFRRLTTEPGLQRWGAGLYLGLSVAAELAYAVAIAGCFQASLFPKRALTVQALIRATAPRLPGFVLTRMLLGFAFLAFAIIIPKELLRSQASGPVQPVRVAVAAILVIFGFHLLFSWALVPLTIVLERRIFIRACIRSVELMRTRLGGGSFDSSSMRLLLGVLPALLVGATLVTAVQTWNLLTHRPLLIVLELPFETERSAAYIARGLIALFCTPLVWVLITTLYVECRMRRDGLDFQVRLIESGAGNPDSELSVVSAV